MPICTSCTHPTQYLYTVYGSADNLRLEQCVSSVLECSQSPAAYSLGLQTSCQAFADPYVEHDTLTLWIDLILLKRDVYRHLLFNRGAGARRLSAGKKEPEGRSSVDSVAESESPQQVQWQQEKVRRVLLSPHIPPCSMSTEPQDPCPEARSVPCCYRCLCVLLLSC